MRRKHNEIYKATVLTWLFNAEAMKIVPKVKHIGKIQGKIGNILPEMSSKIETKCPV